MGRIPIDIALVRDVFDLDEKRGMLIWKKCADSKYNGRRAGVLCATRGYRVVKLGKRRFRASRLIWAHHYGEMPPAIVDHINGDRSDDRVANLRAATPSQNCANRKRHKNNTSGYTGVYQVNGKWAAMLRFEGDARYLGVFSTRIEAALAYRREAARAFGEFDPNACRP